MTINVLDKKIRVESKIPVLRDLVKKMNHNTKISNNKQKVITNSDCNKFMCDIPDAKINEKELVNKSDMSNRVKKFLIQHKNCNISNKRRIKLWFKLFILEEISLVMMVLKICLLIRQ